MVRFEGASCFVSGKFGWTLIFCRKFGFKNLKASAVRRPLRAGRARFELAIGLLLYVLSRDAPSANSATSPNSGNLNSSYFSANFQVQKGEFFLFSYFSSVISPEMP